MFIPRVYDALEQPLQPNKVLILYGPRQVGKTTLLTRFLDRFEQKSQVPSNPIADFGSSSLLAFIPERCIIRFPINGRISQK